MAGRWLGLDLGGTNIKSAIVAVEHADRSDGIDVIGCDHCPAGAEHGPPAVIGNLVAAGRRAVERLGPVDGAAVGVPGLFDDRTGSIELFPNLPGDWNGTSLTAPLETALGVPTSIINDARAFTLAESRLGAAAGCDTVAALGLGTGIGGGIVVGGRLHFGRMGRAGELAHQVIEPDGPMCGCGTAAASKPSPPPGRSPDWPARRRCVRRSAQRGGRWISRQMPATDDLGKLRVRRRHRSSPEGGVTRFFPRMGVRRGGCGPRR
jgi:predicted NBD/HSP70 family sugar kinase